MRCSRHDEVHDRRDDEHREDDPELAVDLLELFDDVHSHTPLQHMAPATPRWNLGGCPPVRFGLRPPDFRIERSAGNPAKTGCLRASRRSPAAERITDLAATGQECQRDGGA